MKANQAIETYPMQFRDKIDEYLWKEHHILGGSCSSIESLKYSVAREVAEKLTDAFIEKACWWLQSHTMKELCMKEEDNELVQEFIESFKDYMKGE